MPSSFNAYTGRHNQGTTFGANNWKNQGLRYPTGMEERSEVTRAMHAAITSMKSDAIKYYLLVMGERPNYEIGILAEGRSAKFPLQLEVELAQLRGILNASAQALRRKMPGKLIELSESPII